MSHHNHQSIFNGQLNQAMPHHNMDPDQKSPDTDVSGEAVDRMGVALFFCLMSIVAVVGLYLCFWAKVEKGNQQDTNRHKIKVLERDVEKLSRKVLWLEGSQAVAECEDRDSSTPPPGYSVLDENRGTSGQVSLETPSYPQTSDTSFLIAQLLSSRTGLSTTPPLCMTAMGYQQLLDTEEICPHHLRHHHQ
eukprot:GFUD01089926.1.p1 GENE.GFUD01089926.1~~GFUD01089926.1.p1  ORF type:complete len:191 (+),score=56.22 GFUD01089926.1:17-589(+)